MTIRLLTSITAVTLALVSCSPTAEKKNTETTFGSDVDFLAQHLPGLIILGDTAAGAVAVSPEYQGRVMTSTADGREGSGLGWINHALIASGKKEPHINAVGGEERFWLGPEGGQFGFYFTPGSAFTFDNWQVPASLDTEPFTVAEKTSTSATFMRDVELINHSGNRFPLHITRTIRMPGKAALEELLKQTLPDQISQVYFESENAITNTGTKAFTAETGLPSVWILSMLNASEGTWIAIPYRPDGQGKIVTDDYFGKVPADRLLIGDSLMWFKADAAYRSKIGVPPGRVLPWMCSVQPVENNRLHLTLAVFDVPAGNNRYVNSAWAQQENPFSGDVANAYNDGPNDTGSQMGKFYELESSSPGADLAPGAGLTHRHRTIHLIGDASEIGSVFRKFTGLQLILPAGN